MPTCARGLGWINHDRVRRLDGRFGVLLRDVKSSSLLAISNWAGKTMRCLFPAVTSRKAR